MFLKRNNLIFLFIVSAICLWLLGINEPFVGSYGANLNYFTLAAKNYIRFGYLNLGFVPSYYAGEPNIILPDVYLHHPVFYFVLVSIPYLILGFHNLVASITPLFFSLIGLIIIYKIGKEIWNGRVGLLSVFFASVFPISAVFNKQTIFEPAVLTIVLLTYYSFILYLKKLEFKYLILIFLSALLGILFDWGEGYLIFPLLVLFPFLEKPLKSKKAIFYYILGITLGVTIFLIQVYFWKGGYDDFINAVKARQFQNELYGNSFPILRLILTSLFRILIYFTPISIFSTFITFSTLKGVIKRRIIDRQSYTILFFLIFGIVNFVFLPTATFGHIYFLIYLTPFFAFTISLFIDTYIKRPKILPFLILFLTFIFSTFVVYSKWQQVSKQSYRYNIANKINKKLIPYEEIAVYGFPGDVFEQYFFHPTVPLNSYIEILEWLGENSDSDKKAIYSCWGECSNEQREFIENINYSKDYFHPNTWLIYNTLEEIDIYGEYKKENTKEQVINNGESGFIQIYRKIRDFLKVGQL